MEKQEDIDLHELETIEQNLAIGGDRESEADNFMIVSASGFMIVSASGFMIV
jgi:hypothetical protein